MWLCRPIYYLIDNSQVSDCPILSMCFRRDTQYTSYQICSQCSPCSSILCLETDPMGNGRGVTSNSELRATWTYCAVALPLRRMRWWKLWSCKWGIPLVENHGLTPTGWLRGKTDEIYQRTNGGESVLVILVRCWRLGTLS